MSALKDAPVDQLKVGLALLAKDVAERSQVQLLPNFTPPSPLDGELLDTIHEEVMHHKGESVFSPAPTLVAEDDDHVNDDNDEQAEADILADPDEAFSKGIKKLPRNLHSQYSSQSITAEGLVKILKRKRLAHKFATATGDRVLRRFGRHLRKTVCGAGGPYEALKKDPLLGYGDVPKMVANSILRSYCVAIALVWIPFCAYLVMILFQTGIFTYCENADHD